MDWAPCSFTFSCRCCGALWWISPTPAAPTNGPPRGGGLAFVLVGSALAPLAGGGWPAWIPLLCLPLALVGLLDDRLDLPAAGRYGIQITTALALVAITP